VNNQSNIPTRPLEQTVTHPTWMGRSSAVMNGCKAPTGPSPGTTSDLRIDFQREQQENMLNFVESLFEIDESDGYWSGKRADLFPLDCANKEVYRILTRVRLFETELMIVNGRC
jgi:hypothetical protein